MKDYHQIKLVVLDVDGTLTENGIYYDDQGNEIKRFSAKDGLGIKVALEAGLQFAIITGRESPILRRRAKELKIAYLKEGVQQKYPVLMALLAQLGLTPDEVCYIGDDLNDMQCMKAMGYSACPADAADEIRAICDYVAGHNGGHGAVRDCLQDMLRARGQWDECAKRLYYVE